MTLKVYKHSPAHLFVDDHIYFITGSVYRKQPLLKTIQAKDIFREYLFHFCEKYSWILHEWVILNNHYHLLTKVLKSIDLPKVINSLHKTTAYYIKKNLNVQVKPFWYQYWDRCIRDEKHYYETATYILYNPVKHDYVNDLNEYPFSSFHDKYKNDEDDLRKKFREYKPQSICYYDELDDF